MVLAIMDVDLKKEKKRKKYKRKRDFPTPSKKIFCRLKAIIKFSKSLIDFFFRFKQCLNTIN